MELLRYSLKESQLTVALKVLTMLRELELWDEMGYEHLNLSSQNLRDQAARLEKSLGNAASNIVSRVGRRRPGNMESNETGQVEIGDNFQSQQDANEEFDLDLHSVQKQDHVNPTGPVSTLSQEACKLLEKATQLFASLFDYYYYYYYARNISIKFNYYYYYYYYFYYCCLFFY